MRRPAEQLNKAEARTQHLQQAMASAAQEAQQQISGLTDMNQALIDKSRAPFIPMDFHVNEAI
jgi:hypothetical protein